VFSFTGYTYVYKRCTTKTNLYTSRHQLQICSPKKDESVSLYILFVCTQTNTHDTPEVDRATCCQLPNETEDICSRSNCTLPCTKPELEIDSISNRKSPLSQAFFIESSGNGALSYRQACAVESLALHNPNLTVNILFTDADINTSLDTVQKLVENYANVQLISINVDEYMAGTVLDHWYHCTNWRNGSYHVNNLSNALRLLTVYKFGGYYFDLDIISVRSVTSYRNFLAAESDKDVNNGVIHADSKHPFIELAITDFVANFR
jgi:lactosylceramide 4-alpha-galactosyltransferase